MQTIGVPDVVVGDYVVSVIASNVVFLPQSFAFVATGSVGNLVIR